MPDTTHIKIGRERYPMSVVDGLAAQLYVFDNTGNVIDWWHLIDAHVRHHYRGLAKLMLVKVEAGGRFNSSPATVVFDEICPPSEVDTP